MPDEVKGFRHSLKSALPHLKVVAVGVVLCVIDFRPAILIGSCRIGFDIFPDWIGLILIASGMVAVARLEGNNAFDVLICIAAGLSVFWATGEILAWFSPRLRGAFFEAREIIGVLATLGMPLLTEAIRQLASASGFKDLAITLRWVSISFVAFWTLPTLLNVVFFDHSLQAQAVVGTLFVVPGLISVAMYVHGIYRVQAAIRQPTELPNLGVAADREPRERGSRPLNTDR